MKSTNSFSRASITASSVLALITIAIVTNGENWATFIPVFVLMGILGITVTRSFDADDQLSPYKWRLVLICTALNTLLFAVLAFIVAGQRNSEAFTSGLILMGFLILPFYYGMSALLAQYLIRKK